MNEDLRRTIDERTQVFKTIVDRSMFHANCLKRIVDATESVMGYLGVQYVTTDNPKECDRIVALAARVREVGKEVRARLDNEADFFEFAAHAWEAAADALHAELNKP